MPDALLLEGKVAIVTGATRGIGRAIAEIFAAHGTTLIINGTDASALDEAVAEIRDRHSAAVSAIAGDISIPSTASDLVRQAFSQEKRLDIFVNNAGVLIDALIGMVTDEAIERTLGVNLKGVLYGIQAAGRLMSRGGGGSIINLTSIVGRFGNAGQLAYASSKAGVIGATLSAAKELAPANVRVNAIAPGFIDTDMVRQLPPEKFEERMASIGMKRIGTPQDVANAALFLASDLSSYVTGQVLGVDGGMLI
jgi:3-oxoacyl-[acyl-carrier protein] reductase